MLELILNSIIKDFLYLLELILLAQVTIKIDEKIYSRNRNAIFIDTTLVTELQSLDIINYNHLSYYLNTSLNLINIGVDI